MHHDNYRIDFLGKPQITFSGGEYKVKSKRLLAMLTIAQMYVKPLSRHQIQRYLWLQDEGLDESVYAGRLRVLLYSNKKIIEQFLEVGVSEISFKKQCNEGQQLSDIQEFNTLVKDGNIECLKQAVELYKGEFLQDFKMRAASFEYEDLLVQQRAYWQNKVTEILDQIINQLLLGKRKVDLVESLYYVQKSLEINPLRDESQIQLAKIYCRNRQRKQAIKQLENYIDKLLKSLNLHAGKDVCELLQELRKGQSLEKKDYGILQLNNVPRFRLVHS